MTVLAHPTALTLALLAVGAAACGVPPPPRDADADTDADLDATATGCGWDAGSRLPDGGACPMLGRDEGDCAELVLGTGRDGTLENFTPLAPSTSLWVTPGEQGLQHIVVAFRGRGFDPTNPLIEVRVVRPADCEEVGYLRFRFPFRADPADPTRLAVDALRVTLTDDREAREFCTVLDHDVVVVANLDDGRGRRLHREARVHIAGIDPAVRPEVRDAWIALCQRYDAGTRDAPRD